MAYVASTQGSSAACSKDFMELALHPNLIANGFAYVEQVVSSTITARVYKSAVASNGVADWYLIVKRASDTATAVTLSVCESYNSTTHLAVAYAPSATAGIPDSANNYRYPDATGLNPASGAFQFIVLNINATGFSYWLSVNSFRLHVATRVGSSDNGVYAGLFDTALPASITSGAVCLGVVGTQTDGLGTGPGAYGALTREPLQTVAGASNYGGNFRSAVGFTFGLYSVAATDVYSGKQYAAQPAVFSTRSAYSVRGLLRSAMLFNQSTAVAGDTATLTNLAGTVGNYTCFGGLCWVDQAA